MIPSAAISLTLRFRLISGLALVLGLIGAVPATAQGTAKRDPGLFSDLVTGFADVSLEKGDANFIRYNAYSSEGRAAIEQYRIAVEVMKAKPSSDPYSWSVQAGIHGTFWSNAEALKEGMILNGYFGSLEDSDPNTLTAARERAEEAFGSWSVVLNNCNHHSQMWLAAQGRRMDEASPDFSVVFQAWHRMYLMSFEKVVRQVLIDEKRNPDSVHSAALMDVDVSRWALPYWDYRDPKTGALPPEFRVPTTQSGQANSLYEPLRSPMMNEGLTVQEINLPDADLLLADNLFSVGSDEANYTVGQYFNESVVLQQKQPFFASFNSMSELSPHAVAHDIVGALADSPADKLDLWLAMVKLASNEGIDDLWSGDESPAEFQHLLEGKTLLEFADSPENRETFLDEIAPLAIPAIFGDTPSIGPTLLGYVPTAARDPIFFLHHAYVDKIWSEYNSMSSASFITEDILDNAGWNFTFWEPDDNGDPILASYSTWKNASFRSPGEENITSNQVMRALYYPSYVYDYIQPLDIAFNPIAEPANKFVALLDSTMPGSTLAVLDLGQQETAGYGALKDLAFTPIDVDLPVTAGVVREVLVAAEDINPIHMELRVELEVPMNSSDNVGLLIGDLEFLQKNSAALEQFWYSWRPAPRDNGALSGSFEPGNEFRLIDLDGTEIYGQDAGSVVASLSLPRFNPMAMTAKLSDGHHSMRMTSNYSADVSLPINAQFELDKHRIIDDASKLGILILSNIRNDVGAAQTHIGKIEFSLNQDHGNMMVGNNYDRMSLLNRRSQHTQIYGISNLESWYSSRAPSSNEFSTYIERAENLGYVYLASNPDLISRFDANPLRALEHYLIDGLREGRSLSSWTMSIEEEKEKVLSSVTVAEMAKEFVLNY